MKKFLFVLAILLTICLYGCSTNSVDTLNNWSFQYNEETNDYSVFFELRDKSGNSISADIDADIRIVNDEGEEVFNSTSSVTEDDFGYYTSMAKGELYLANIRIPATEIAPGKSSNGTVYLTIYKEGVGAFDEVNCDASYCLPIKDIELVSGPFPVEVDVRGFDGSVMSTIQIEDVSYEFDGNYSSTLTVTIEGTKTYGNGNFGFDMIGYKLYDSEEFMVDSGSVYLDPLNQGDKFKDDSIIFFDLTPGETYILKFVENEF